MRFRRSSSRKARGVSHTLDRSSQNCGEKLEVLWMPLLDLIFLVGGCSCDGSSARCLFRFCGLAMSGHGGLTASRWDGRFETRLGRGL